MQNYHASTQYVGESEKQIAVASSKCLYQVQVTDSELRLLGPGVDETTDYDGWPAFDNDEDLCVFAVLVWENGLWNEL